VNKLKNLYNATFIFFFYQYRDLNVVFEYEKPNAYLYSLVGIVKLTIGF